MRGGVSLKFSLKYKNCVTARIEGPDESNDRTDQNLGTALMAQNLAVTS